MNGQVQSSWVARCRELKKEGMTIKGISEECHISPTTVGRYVRGIVDQREKREMQSKTVSPIFPDNKVGKTGNADQNSISHKSHISRSIDVNADQDSISHISHSSNSIGVYILFFLLLAILILLLLDRFVLEGKILGWFFGQLKPQDHSEVTEQKVGLIGFEGRSLEG